jgi:hypothetical protein
MKAETARSPQEDGMFQAIRKTAQVVTTTMNFCLSPACLHATKTKGCACCARGHGAKKKGKRK